MWTIITPTLSGFICYWIGAYTERQEWKRNHPNDMRYHWECPADDCHLKFSMNDKVRLRIATNEHMKMHYLNG